MASLEPPSAPPSSVLEPLLPQPSAVEAEIAVTTQSRRKRIFFPLARHSGASPS
jgi:hypothetical protein